MADNVQITAGSGTTIAADDIGGVMHQRVKLSLGADGVATDASAGAGAVGAGTQRVTLASDDPGVVAIAANKINLVSSAKSSFTRPSNTTAYAIGDLIANSTTAGSVTRMSWTGATKTGSGGSGIISGVVVSKTGSVGCTIRIHFLKTDHAVTNGDNGALVLTSLDIDNYIGYMDVSFNGNALTAIGSSAAEVVEFSDKRLDYTLSSGDTIYAVMQAVSAFTPANAGVFSCALKLQVFS